MVLWGPLYRWAPMKFNILVKYHPGAIGRYIGI